MEYTFWVDIIGGKKYKKIVHYLCNVSDAIYFTYYDDYMINDDIFKFSKMCKKVTIPHQLTRKISVNENVVGYEIDIHIIHYIFEFSSIYDLLKDRVYGTIFFYNGEKEVLLIHLGDFNEIYIQTNQVELIKEFRGLR